MEDADAAENVVGVSKCLAEVLAGALEEPEAPPPADHMPTVTEDTTPAPADHPPLTASGQSALKGLQHLDAVSPAKGAHLYEVPQQPAAEQPTLIRRVCQKLEATDVMLR